MVIYDLTCDNDHSFEGWFSGLENYQEQLSRNEIACPVCNSTAITKLPHTCAVHMKREEAPAPVAQRSKPAMPTPEQFREALIRVHHYVQNNFEDVGPRFAEEARRIHDGEVEERSIHGTATPEEQEALDDDQIPYMTLPKPELDS
jgi:hypothetical protein